MTELRESPRKSRPDIDFRLPPCRDMIFDTVREMNNVEREHKWIVADLGWNVFTLCRGLAQNPDFIYGIQKRLEAEAEQKMAEGDGKIVLPAEKSME